MCGIAGAFAWTAREPIDVPSLLAMRDSMTARGPDGFGLWVSDDSDVGLAHRRLSIIDLSDNAMQPMPDASGRYVIVFNGEIYNYQALRNELIAAGAIMRTTSDTEVIVELFARHGVNCFKQLRGMFAIAIYDNSEKSITFARDTFGIKPLYYTTSDKIVSFASQVKALVNLPDVDRSLDKGAMAAFHIWGSVPDPQTMFRGIKALPAGHYMIAQRDKPKSAPVSFSNIQSLGDQSNDRAGTSASEAFRDSVEHHIIADVDVGCFLSSGVDSGALLGLMRDCGRSKVRTITLAFKEYANTDRDESPLAADMARQYGAGHNVEFISGEDFTSSLADIFQSMDQPSIDGINTWFVSRAAKNLGLKVALSGLGADELLGGYSTFSTVPRTMALGQALSRVPGGASAARRLLPYLARVLGPSKSKIAHAAHATDTVCGAYIFHRSLTPMAGIVDGEWGEILRDGLLELSEESRLRSLIHGAPDDIIQQISILEASQYMRNQLLRDADWAGMAHSLEIRVPFVDTELWRTLSPRVGSHSGGRGKLALANSPSIPLPDAVTYRPKTGFGIPVDRWTNHASGSNGPDKLHRWSGQVLSAYARATGLDIPA